VLEEALRETLARRRRRGRTVPALTIVDGRGVRAGIDLDDSAALLDAMEDRRGPA
jgi:hypothetical protein